jgi:hypothetical protein
MWSTLYQISANIEEVKSSNYIRMPIKHTPEHPITTGSIFTSNLRHLNDLFGMVVLDRIVAWGLHNIVSHNSLPSAN